MSDSTLKKAIQLAVKLKELAPWTYMDETEVFGVRMPDTGKQYFVSIMGAAGVHYGMAAYEGTEGLMGFWDLQQPASWARPGELLLIPHLMVSFEDRDMIDAPIRAKMKELGFNFSGQHAWPDFKQVTPGFFPTNLAVTDCKGECDEGACNEGEYYSPLHNDLVTVMEQALHVFERAKADVDLLYPEDADEDTYLMRAMTSAGDEPPQWQDTWWQLVPPKTGFDMIYDVRERARIAGLPRCRGEMLYAKTLQADMALMPNQVAEPGKKVYFPSIEMRHPLFYMMAKKVLHPTKIKIVLLPALKLVEEVLKGMDENL